MAAASISDAAIKEMAKKALEFKYIALDSSATAYVTTQSAPISEITTNGGARASATATHDSETGVVTMTKQFVFTGTVSVKAVCPMNNATAGNGVALYRYLPPDGTLPSSFESGGSLLVNITVQCARPT